MSGKTPITVAHGDGIGPEIMQATLAIIQAAGAQIEIDMAGGVIKNITRNESYNTTPLPDFLREIVDAGGLVEYTRRQVSGVKA